MVVAAVDTYLLASCMGKHVAIKIHVAINTWCYASIFDIFFIDFFVYIDVWTKSFY